MRTTLLLLAVLLLPSLAVADDGDDTLRYYLSKSEIVVLGEFTSDPNALALVEELTVHHYADFKISRLIMGDALELAAGKTIRVKILRFASQLDHPHELTKGGKCILFLKATRQDRPAYQSADCWFAVQPPNTHMADSLERLSRAKP